MLHNTLKIVECVIIFISKYMLISYSMSDKKKKKSCMNCISRTRVLHIYTHKINHILFIYVYVRPFIYFICIQRKIASEYWTIGTSDYSCYTFFFSHMQWNLSCLILFSLDVTLGNYFSSSFFLFISTEKEDKKY